MDKKNILSFRVGVEEVHGRLSETVNRAHNKAREAQNKRTGVKPVNFSGGECVLEVLVPADQGTVILEMDWDLPFDPPFDPLLVELSFRSRSVAES